MKFKAQKDYIEFEFQKQELTEDIKSILSRAEAEVSYTQGVVKAKIQNEKIAELNIHEIKKLVLPDVYPHHMAIQTKGRPTTPAFSCEIKFIGPQSRPYYQKKRTGVILNLDGRDFTLTNPHFSFLEKLEKLSPEIKNPGERLGLWAEVIKVAPKEVVLDNKELLDFQYVKADRFCLDKNPLPDGKFQIVPELIYRESNNEDTGGLREGSATGEKELLYKENNNEDAKPASQPPDGISSDFKANQSGRTIPQAQPQLPDGISSDFKKQFLNFNSVDPYYKVGNYYIKLSEPLRICLRIIKKINREPLEKRRAFYLNPMERIKKEIPEDLSENLLEDIFVETENFKSDRISRLGKWVPKIGIYIDPDNKNPWFPKEDIAIKIGDGLFHFSPDDLDALLKDMEQAKKNNQDVFNYKNQAIPVNDEVIFEIKNVRDKIRETAKDLSSANKPKPEAQKLSKLVAIIKDNIDRLEYQRSIGEKRDYLKKEIPPCLQSKFYPHQEEGVLWLMESFIKGAPGALLADDMGLGKTFQALAFLYWYKESGKNKKPILIVAPTGLLNNWRDEHDEHLLKYGGLGRNYKAYGESFRKDRKKPALSIIKEMKKSDWILTTYESIRDHHTDFFIKISWGIVVFDEIQKIKNPNALMTDASKALDSAFSIGLTGTPIENSFTDLWCISDCLYPKILGLLKDFHNKYIKSRGENKGQDIQNRLSKKQPPFIRRRNKTDILEDLPNREIIIKKENMEGEQKEIYSEIIRKAKNKEYSNSLQALSLLKRFSIYTQDCFKGSDKEFIQSNIKLKILFEILEKIEEKREKALICIESRVLQKKIKGICDAKWNLSLSLINGDMPGDRRKKTVDEFGKTEGFNIMIISPRAGGVGLNIVSANHIIHLERWWNPAVEDQSNDRIFRIGQNRDVFVYYPLAVHPDYKEESFDVVLDELLKRKRKMREQILMPSEPNQHEQSELYRNVTRGEEPYHETKESFYDRPEWGELRSKVFQTYPSICMRCGNKENLQVDHIKPRSKYPELELESDNLQILCQTCNLLKGDKESFYDSPEWRELRSKFLQKHPSICMRCGNKDIPVLFEKFRFYRRKNTEKYLDVYHIKPRSKYPELELEFDNLQILCQTCKPFKGEDSPYYWNFT